MAAKDIEPHKFKKGQTGNPKGRPKKIPELEALINDVFGDQDAMKQILTSLQAQAKKGNIRAAEIILDRAYGKPKQSIDHTTDGEKMNSNITVNILTPAPPVTSEDDIPE
jgi:Family of unknown function (DUF5681)